MTCKDCVHYEVCQTRDGQTEFYGIDVDCNNVEELCNHFKPKSRFVELPCEVGRTVWTLIDGYISPAKVWGIVTETQMYEEQVHLKVRTKNKQGYTLYKTLLLGKNVFLSKEAAEEENCPYKEKGEKGK